MSQESQSSLRFSLEESLWFRKGQEVEELLSISLDPDITIQENDQYVTIRGSLVLTGEYKRCGDSQDSEERDVTSQKFVQQVADREAGNCEFSHRFPVDITIPQTRIQSIYDIDVLVDSFDYSIPERSCLKLTAELTISGLYEQQSEEQFHEEPQEIAVTSRTESSQASEETEADSFLFSAEAKKPKEEEEPEAVLPQFPTFHYQEEEAVEPINVFEEYQPQVSEPLLAGEQGRSEGKPQEEVEQEINTENEVKAEVEMEAELTEHDDHEHSQEDESSSSSPEKPKHKKTKLFSKSKTMTLTEFFARKDEGTAQVKLKVCIVQKGDTVDSLAERYDVSVANLLRVNNLDSNQDVFEGQVLYIPATLAKK
ncbi:stage VI sporulation protein D [Bacillus rubiinfantis]|uniref:stage VI sporulation protein D n=1 Tax=Bacillus rubiinfantis TaxID=1499680 RepID=UPI0005A731A4|nr:stage VI sporulation protein D [Bacillus rubiinfantis]